MEDKMIKIKRSPLEPILDIIIPKLGEGFSNDDTNPLAKAVATIRDGNFGCSKSSYPKVNIIQRKDVIIVECTVVGHTKDTVKVEYDAENGDVIVSGESVNTSNSIADEYVRREIKLSSFNQRIPACDPDTIDVDKITSKCENGLLTVVLPLKEELTREPEKPKLIQVD